MKKVLNLLSIVVLIEFITSTPLDHQPGTPKGSGITNESGTTSGNQKSIASQSNTIPLGNLEDFLENKQRENVTKGAPELCSCQTRQTAEEYFTEVLKRIIGFVQRELRRQKVPKIKLSPEAIDAISGNSLKIKKKRGKGLLIEGKNDNGERFLSERSLKEVKSEITKLLQQLEGRTPAFKASKIVEMLAAFPDRTADNERIFIKNIADGETNLDTKIPFANPMNITETQLRLLLFRSRISTEKSTDNQTSDQNAVLLGLDHLVLDGDIEIKRPHGKNVTVLANFVFDSANVVPLDNLDQPGLVHFPVEGYAEILVSVGEKQDTKIEVILHDFGMAAPGTNDFNFHKSITDLNIRREIAKEVRRGLRQSSFSFNVEDTFEEAVFTPEITSAFSSKKAATFLVK